MTNVELRIPPVAAHALREAIILPTKENVAFGLAGSFQIGNKWVVLVREIIPVPEQMYANVLHGTSWSPTFSAQVLNSGMKDKLGLVIFHSHGSTQAAQLSRIDVLNGRSLLRSFNAAIDYRPHGTVVFGKRNAAGLFLLPNGREATLTHLRWQETHNDDWVKSECSLPTIDPIYQTQELMIGVNGQKKLRDASVAIIGLGGGGSHVVQQLSYLGIGKLILVDPDILEGKNIHRVIGSSKINIGHPKVEISRRLALGINRKIKVISIQEKFSAKESLMAIKQADIVVSAVDRLFPRVEIQSWCHRYAIPLVDIGMEIRIKEWENECGRPTVQRVGGHVAVILPTHGCLWCYDIITDRKLEAESQGREPSYVAGKQGEAQVVSFNGVLASQACSEILNLITNFSRECSSKLLILDGLKGTMNLVVNGRYPSCSHHADISIGDPIWTTI